MTDEVEKKDAKKAVKKKVSDVIKNSIELNPTLKEQSDKTVVLGWGRMNPVTVGHEKLANKIKSVAKQNNATPLIYLTHSHDAKKNPLKYNDKIALAQTAFGRDVVKKSNAKTIIQAMQEIDGQYDNVVLVVGQDRVAEFDKLLQKYNGKDYTFDTIKIVSAGDRDPDAEGVEGMSASKMRAAAAAGKKDDFVSGLPKKLKRQGDKVYDMVRSGMGINEEVDLDEKLKASDDMGDWIKDFQDSDAPQFKGKSQKKRREMAIAAKLDAEEQNEEVDVDEERKPLTTTQRRKIGMAMRRNKAKIAAGRRRAAKRKPTASKLKKRAEKRARNIIRKKVIGKSDMPYDKLAASQKAVVDKKVAKRKAAIKRLTKKLIPKMRKEEFDADSINESFDALFEKRVAQDSDIKDMEGTQPKKYYSGVKKSQKDDRARHFAKGAKMDDDNPAAYKPAPGDAGAKTKESKHTKKYREMFGEASENDVKPKKRYHNLMNKNGTPKIDKRFKAFRSKKSVTEQFENDEDVLKLVDEIWESVQLEESKTKKALDKKSDKSGISYSILKDVYDRGVAAWRTGHRPGTTPAQWGMARVNSFITGGKTRKTADADLWKKHSAKNEEVELGEAADEQLSYDGKTTKNFDVCPGAVGAFKKNIEDGKDVDKAVKAVDAYLGIEKRLANKDDVTQQDYDKMKSAVDRAKKVIDDAGLEGHEYHDMHLKRVEKMMKGVSEQIELESFFDLNEAFELAEASILDKALAAIHKHVMSGTELQDIAWDVSRARGVNIKAKDLVAKYKDEYGDPKAFRSNPDVRNRLKKKYGVGEEHGAGDWGTDKLTKKYKKDTPGESINESFNNPYRIKWNTKTEKEWFGLAKDNELSIQIKDGSGSGMYGIVFKLNDKLFSPGTGDQFRIFATVVAAVKEWWAWASKNVDVKSIWFSAEKVRGNDSRSKLYSRFAKQFARETGYKLKVSTDLGADIYYLKKPQVNENISQRFNIVEALDNPYPYRWIVDEDDEKIAVAKINRGEKLEIIFEAFDEEHAWEIAFKVDGSMSATDRGDQFRIFATVTKAVKEWLQQMVSEKQPLRQITFRAFKEDKDDISREKLYGRFAKRMASTIRFKFSKKDYGDEVAFYLDNPKYKPVQENFANEKVKGKSSPGRAIRAVADIYNLKKPTVDERVINEAFEGMLNEQCDLIGMDQIKAFEKFVDRMFDKFGIDFKFTKHFGERMSDSRNDPCIKLKELAGFIKKIYAKQGKSLKSVAGAEAVIKDLQSDLNIPVAVEYDSRNDEFDVVMKTVMRKKNFRTPNKVIKY